MVEPRLFLRPDRSLPLRRSSGSRSPITRFQLVFRQNGSERIETRDNNRDGEPQIDGTLIVDGETYVIRGVEWLVTREDIDDTKRFVCTLVAEPADTA